MELVRETKESAEEDRALFNSACLDRGLIGNVVRMPGQLSICRMAPPLTIGYDELDRGLEVLDEALTLVAESMARPAPADLRSDGPRIGQPVPHG
jgi:2,2-dialkylglycine decarboxylase (pyruvate)